MALTYVMSVHVVSVHWRKNTDVCSNLCHTKAVVLLRDSDKGGYLHAKVREKKKKTNKH